MFDFIQAKNMTTRNPSVIYEKFCNTERYYNSSVPYMSRVLNGVYLTEKREKGLLNQREKLWKSKKQLLDWSLFYGLINC